MSKCMRTRTDRHSAGEAMKAENTKKQNELNGRQKMQKREHRKKRENNL